MMRLALVSTPRSGNTWFRYMLASLHGLEQNAVHDPFSLDWGRQPERLIVQVHWRREPRFVEMIEVAGYRAVTISRHPFDVLLSILQFSKGEPATRHWLLEDGDGEASIRGRSPLDAEFAAYACSERAARLLAVTPDWWGQPRTVCVRYEDLVRDPAGTLGALNEPLGNSPARDVSEVVEANRIERLRPTSWNGHFWQGQPGLWRSLLTEEVAARLADAHASVLNRLGYGVDLNGLPGADEIRDRWQRMASGG